MTAHPHFKTVVLVSVILFPISVNQLYPGEVFHHSRFLFILTSFLAFLLALLYRHQQGVNDFISRSLTISLLTMLCLLPSWFGSINKTRSQEVLWLFLAYLLLLLSLTWLDFNFKQIEGAVAVVCFVATIVGLVALYQYYFGLDELRKKFQEASYLDPGFKSRVLARIQSRRILANFPLPNTLAGFLATILPLQVYFAASRTSTHQGCRDDATGSAGKNRFSTTFMACSCLLSLVVLALTQTFGGWAAVLASVTFAGLLMVIPRKLRLGRVAASFVLLFVLLVVWMAWVTHERGFALGNLKASTNPMVLRWNNYKTAWHIFEDFPWTGVGLGNYGTINPHYQGSPLTVTQYAHDTPLQLLSEVGMMFFILAASLLILLFKVLKLLLAIVRGEFGNPHRGNRSLNSYHSTRNQVSSGLHRLGQVNRPVQLAPSTITYWCRTEAGNRMALSIALASSLAAWGVHNLIDINLYFPSVGSLGILILGLLLSLIGTETIETERVVSSGWLAKTVWIVGLLVCIGSSLLVGRQYLAQTDLAQGIDSVAAKDLNTAQRDLRDSLQINSNNPITITLEAKVRLQLAIQQQRVDHRLLESVLHSFERAASLDPYNAETVYELGRILMALGREDEARKARLRARDLFPSEPKYQEPFKVHQNRTEMGRQE